MDDRVKRLSENDWNSRRFDIIALFPHPSRQNQTMAPSADGNIFHNNNMVVIFWQYFYFLPSNVALVVIQVVIQLT